MNLPFQSKLLLVLFLVVLLADLPAKAQKEILCRSNDQRFDRPGECAARCAGEFETERCALEPLTSALNDVFLTTYYNTLYFNNGNYLHTRSCLTRQVDLALGTSGQGGVAAVRVSTGDSDEALRSKLLERMIVAWFNGYQIGNFNMIWGRDEVHNIGIAAVPAQSGRFPVYVSVNLLCKSPDYIAASVGHELIHVEQYNRHYGLNIDDLSIRKVRDAMREVEAYEWETNTGGFAWKINTRNLWLGGFSAAEKSDLQTLSQCAGWKLANEIEQLRTQPDAEGALKKLQLYFQQDVWVHANWLPHHPDWAVRASGPEPVACQNLPFAAY